MISNENPLLYCHELLSFLKTHLSFFISDHSVLRIGSHESKGDLTTCFKHAKEIKQIFHSSICKFCYIFCINSHKIFRADIDETKQATSTLYKSSSLTPSFSRCFINNTWLVLFQEWIIPVYSLVKMVLFTWKTPFVVTEY